MRLHFHPLSGCSRRVLAFLQVHEIPFEPVPVALDQGEHKKPPYLQLNPAGRVPTLEDDAVGTLTESLAILRYLAARHAPDALGTDPAERARVDQWSSWSLAHASAAAGRLNAETGLKRMRGESPEPEAVARATAELEGELAIAGQVLEQRPFLAGEHVTVADFVLGPNLESTRVLSGHEPTHPAVHAWMERLQRLPGWPEMPSRG